MNKSKERSFDLIVLVQSYPNIIHAVNYILRNKNKTILVLVNGDRKIFSFFKSFLDYKNITIKKYGNNIFLRSRFFSWLLPLYVMYLNFIIPEYKSDEKLLTYGNWCDVGAIFHHKTKSKKTINLIAYEENKYSIHRHQNQKLPFFIKKLNSYTNHLVERKRYLYEEDGETKEIERDSFGMKDLHDITEIIYAPRERDYSVIKDVVKGYENPFILYIEKNLIKTKAISYLNYIRLNISIYRLSKKNNTLIGIKFKPRDRYFFRKYFYRMLGFKILPSYIPAQLYSVQDNCKFIIGFSSSSMAENYGKAIYSFGSIKSLFNSSVYGNINSLKQRSYGNDLCIFLEERTELENLQ